MREACLAGALLAAFWFATCDSGSDPGPGDAAGDAAGDALLEGRLDGAAEASEVAARGCAAGICAADETHAPNPAEWGPFPVGVRTFSTSLKDYQDGYRELTVEVWYPATEEAREGPFEDVDLVERAPADVAELLPAMKLPPVPAKQVREAPMRTADGPYPLVLFSHGAFGVRFQSMFFTTYLASHGYVVVSPDHSGNTLYDMIKAGGYSLDPVIESAFNRPLDITHLLDLMLEWNLTPGDFYEGTIDPERIGITGHSFGGYTCFVSGFEDQDRVKVVVPMAPATQQMAVLGYEIEEFLQPTLMIAGGMDNTLDTQKDMRDGYAKLTCPRAYMEFPTGGHYTFTDICSLDVAALANEMGFVDAEDAMDDGCADFNVPIATAHPLIRQFGIGFLNYHLRSSPGSATYFSTDSAEPWVEQGILVYQYNM
jgi:predicted dienelactone hydrolase